MNTKTKIKVRQLVILGAVWMIIGVFITLYDHLVLHTLSSRGPTEAYSFQFALLLNLTSALIGSLLGGGLLIFYVNERYFNKPYSYTISSVVLGYAFVIICIVIVLGTITTLRQIEGSILDPPFIQHFKAFLYDPSRIKNTIIWLFVVALTQFLIQIDSKLGHGNLLDVVRGTYYTPREEEKIFLFLDITSSTTIAEQLGDKRYHALLKDFFADITNPILNNNGEIYQYVGDEVVVAWNYKEGIKDSQCIKCFFDIKNQIKLNEERYTRRYGLIPSFKGCIHAGKVVAGEIGTIKREITYSGDVLNTTSRILSICKEFNADFLTSNSLLKNMRLGNQYLAQQLGAIKLRGKENEVTLSAIVSQT